MFSCKLTSSLTYSSGKLPFQDEFREILLLDFIRSRIPARYRLRRDIDDFVGDIHRAARLNAEFVGNLKDETGEGDLKVKTKEEEQKEKQLELEKQIKALKRRLRKLKKTNAPEEEIRRAQLDITSLEDSREVLLLEAKGDSIVHDFEVNQPVTAFGDEKDDLKKMNLALLRIPFDTKVDQTWINLFATISLGIVGVILLYKISTTSYYSLTATVRPYGLYRTQFEISSFAINFLAFANDFKELYYVLRYVIPIRSKWVPLITVDKTEDVSSVFIGEYAVQLDDVVDSHPFSQLFAYLCAAAFAFASLPLALILLIVREQFLSFDIMRFLTPLLGLILVARVILGPSFLIKTAFCIHYLFNVILSLIFLSVHLILSRFIFPLESVWV